MICWLIVFFSTRINVRPNTSNNVRLRQGFISIIIGDLQYKLVRGHSHGFCGGVGRVDLVITWADMKWVCFSFWWIEMNPSSSTRLPTSRNVKQSNAKVWRGITKISLSLFRYETSYEDVCETQYEQQVSSWLY